MEKPAVVANGTSRALQQEEDQGTQPKHEQPTKRGTSGKKTANNKKRQEEPEQVIKPVPYFALFRWVAACGLCRLAPGVQVPASPARPPLWLSFGVVEAGPPKLCPPLP